MALVSAVPIAYIANNFSVKKAGPQVVGGVFALILLFMVVNQQMRPTINQLKKGPELSEVVGKSDRPMLSRLKTLLKEL